MKILVIGSGGREHAICWKLAKSSLVDKLYAAPGNAGIFRHAELANIRVDDIDNLLRFAKEKSIDLTVVGPEVPLALGIVDRFEAERLKIFGPTKLAAEIEASKAYAKQFMRKYHIPTASYMVFEDMKEALRFVKGSSYPLVIKADGLAAGKGVSIVKNYELAEKTIKNMMQKRQFGAAGAKIVVEDFLVGEEASVFAFTDGKHVLPLIPSQDHKRVGDGDTGPNTGGMGAYAPVPFVSDKVQKDILDLVLEPTVAGMAEEGRPFRGLLYAGMMITDKGPKVIEFNCRFGDPETQALLPLLKTDLAMIFQAVVNGTLADEVLEWEDAYAACVILVSGGYPGEYESGKEIHGLKDIKDSDALVFHSGTKFEARRFLTNGGRVIGIVGVDEHLESAVARAYETNEKIRFEGKQFRSDIGYKAWTKKFKFLP
ncbi:MAG: phosphoribosylamine--glycine ligase [candidate division Zixibacteria bacterium]|nr:phosphoribosylamine--glycine ligase [candidate division Zixibacteria bacterium]